MDKRSRVLACACLLPLLFGVGCGDDDGATAESPTTPARAGAQAMAGGGGAPLSAAGSGGPGAATTDDDAPPETACQRGVIEPDFDPSELDGPGVQDGKLVAGDYVLSTTFLELRVDPASQQRFGELMGPILADLKAREGLLAVSLGNSAQCGSARTLAVWRDDVAMFGFVTGSAHSAAMASVGEVSRGGSVVTHWAGNAAEATWSKAAEHIGAEDGPFY